jgi:GNAT superfamily N-acetyltransferase
LIKTEAQHIDNLKVEVINMIPSADILGKMSPMVFPYAKQLINGKNGNYFGVVAIIDKAPNGLLIAERISGISLEILSIVILPKYRGRGIGKSLIEKCLFTAKQEQLQFVDIKFIDSFSMANELERLLVKTNFAIPKATLFNMKIDVEQALNISWTNNAFVEDNSIVFKDYQQITPQEKNEIADIISSENIVAHLSPLACGIAIEPSLSKLILKNNSIIGWCIRIKVNDTTYSTDQLFIKEAYRNQQLVEALFSLGLKDAKNKGFKYNIFKTETGNRVLVKYFKFLFENTNAVVQEYNTKATRIYL